MKSFIVLGFILVLAIVTSAESNYGFNKYIHALPPNVMEKCLTESHLETDKDKLLTDETTVDPEKFSCFIACTLKESGAMVNGEIKFDVLSEIMQKLFSKKEERVSERLEIIQNCLPEGTGSTDCEKMGHIVKCVQMKLKEKNL